MLEKEARLPTRALRLWQVLGPFRVWAEITARLAGTGVLSVASGEGSSLAGSGARA